MPLMRKTLFSDNKIILTIPSQITKAYSILNDGIQKINTLNGKIVIKKFIISNLLKDNR
jgi:hypothetical protein